MYNFCLPGSLSASIGPDRWWEPTYDESLWKQDGVLHVLCQKLPSSGISYAGQVSSTPVSGLEWNAWAYFDRLLERSGEALDNL